MATTAGYIMIGAMAAGIGCAAAFIIDGRTPAKTAAEARTAKAETVRLADAPTLVMFETSACGWCHRFHKELKNEYLAGPYQARAPLRFVNLAASRDGGYKLNGPIPSVPTFVLIGRDGREVDRRPGYPGGIEAFHNQVASMLRSAKE